MRAQEYLDSLPGSEQRGVNKFLKGLGETLLPVRQTMRSNLLFSVRILTD